MYYLQSVRTVVPPMYVHTRNKSLSSQDLVYVRSKSLIFPSSVLSDPKPKLTI
jgi:hypothetical protein